MTRRGKLIREKTLLRRQPDGFFKALFVIPKKGGGYWEIVNLKALNNFVAYFHFKMEGLDAVKQLLEPGNFMTKLDVFRKIFV